MSYSDKMEELQGLRAKLRQLEAAAEREAKRMSPLTEKDERDMSAMQARADESYQVAGRRAPPPLGHERPDEYQRRLIGGVQGYSPRWAKADINAISTDALPIAEQQIYADAATHGRTAGLQARQIKPIESRTAAGHTTISFVGGPEASFVRQFERPARRAMFMAPEHYQNMANAAAMAGIASVGRRQVVQSPRNGF
jgi:hypothetical protein